MISTMGRGEANGSLFKWLLALNAACSVSAGVGLLRGVKDLGPRIVFGIMLGVLFFCLNVVIVVFVGCSKMGPM